MAIEPIELARQIIGKANEQEALSRGTRQLLERLITKGLHDIYREGRTNERSIITSMIRYRSTWKAPEEVRAILEAIARIPL